MSGGGGGGDDDEPVCGERGFEVSDEAGGGEDFADADGVEPEDATASNGLWEGSGDAAETLSETFAVGGRAKERKEVAERPKGKDGGEREAVEEHQHEAG